MKFAGAILLAVAALFANPIFAQSRIPAPSAFGKLVEREAREMRRAGYFRNIGENDFFHGHLIFPAGTSASFSSLDDALAHASLILYHTDESLAFWHGQKTVTPLARAQRSIAGEMDGTVVQAIGFLNFRAQELPLFDCCGTIDPEDFARLFPKRFAEMPEIFLVSRAAPLRKLVNQFTLYRTPRGRFEAGGVRFDIYFETVSVR